MQTANMHEAKTKLSRLLEDAANIWEVAIKRTLNRPDFRVCPGRLQRTLFANGYDELAIGGRHAVAAGTLPALHKDPFDRILVAQAQGEDVTLLTNNATAARYPGDIATL